MATTMKAVVFVPGPTGATVEVRDWPVPTPGPGEALVRVHAAGLNRGELAVRAGLRSGPPQQTGIEFAGEIVALAADPPASIPPGRNARLRVGDRVMGHWRGGQAEYVAVDERLLVPVPDRLGWREAGAWLNVFTTAHDALVTAAQTQRGEAVLINAASSGIGVAALQIARWLGASPIIGSSRSPDKLPALRRWGLEVAVPAADAVDPDGGPDTATRVREATGGRGVDVLIDSVGANVLDLNLRAMAIGGRLVSVGRLGANSGAIDLDFLALRRLRIIGVTFRTRTLEERIGCVTRCAHDLLPALTDGRLEPVIDRTFPMADVAAAHDCLSDNRHVGKIVLDIA